MMIRRIVIPRHERGLLYRDGAYLRMLRPGAHWLLDWRPLEVRRLSPLTPGLQLPDLELLVQDPELAGELLVARVADDQRGVLTRDGNLAGVLGPGLHAFLRGPVSWKVDLVELTSPEVRHPLGHLLAGFPGAQAHVAAFEVPDGHQGLVYLDGVEHDQLGPGRHLYWRGPRQLRMALVPLREQALEVQGQELMTADKVSLRVNLSARFRVRDPGVALGTQVDFKEALYRDLQLALRDEVGALKLEELLERKSDLGLAVAARVAEGAAGYGVELRAVGLRDVILPGEMRALLNQVIEAEKRAEAGVITRREETAATRSLLNTARLLEQNPLLLHLKELESVERIAARVGSLSVHGGLDGLLESLRRVVRSPDLGPPGEAP